MATAAGRSGAGDAPPVGCAALEWSMPGMFAWSGPAIGALAFGNGGWLVVPAAVESPWAPAVPAMRE
ncbi:MAG TPA: hypothetical protein VMT87_07785 [Vicinamibacteria bacterium]|nr:hypothetical protein [Vicinamibacteria bacterium]